MELREWLWWPSAGRYAAATGIALISVALLGFTGIAPFPAFKEFEAIPETATMLSAWVVALFAVNACIFYMNACGDFVRVRSGIRPISISFILLSVMFVSLVGQRHVLTNHIRLVWPWLADVGLTSKVIFVGEGGLTIALLFGGIWKTAVFDTAKVTFLLDEARPLLKRAFLMDAPQLTEQEAERLRGILQLLSEQAKELRVRRMTSRDEAYVARLHESTGRVRRALEAPVLTFGDPKYSADPNLKSYILDILTT